MTIAFVLDCLGLMTNGTTATALRFARELEKKGHTVKLLGVQPQTKEIKDDNFANYVGFEKFHFPCFEWLIEKEGFMFARKDDRKMVEALKGCDVVHLFLPFPFENRARLIAEALQIPVTGAFHLQPDTITYTIYLQKLGFITSGIYSGFYRFFYKNIKHIHCPSEMISDQLIKRKYRGCEFNVISNGVSPFFHPVKVEKPAELKNKFIVLMVGRLSREKRQDIIIKALGRSKHNKDIQLILSGQGPNEKALRKEAAKHLENPVIIGFNSREKLRDILCYSDLYIHASDAEIEGISCIEAIACGLVPVISDSPISATNRYALDKKLCIFHKDDAGDLAAKIDYFFENPSVRDELSEKYVEYSKDFALEKEVDRFEKFLEEGISDYKNRNDIVSTGNNKKDIRKVRRVAKKIREYL